MKIFLTFVSILALAILLIFSLTRIGDKSNKNNSSKELTVQVQDGDIIFQTSLSSQSKAIQLATHSKYSHMGIIYIENGKSYVYEAIQPVKITSLKAWIKRGEGGNYVVKRLRDANRILTPDILQRMKKVGSKYKGKDYDIYFEWSDNRIYCSELVWKIYKEGAGIEIGSLQKLKDFDLSNPAVRKIIKKRYGNNIPMEEKVISPVSMFDDEELVRVE